MLQAEVLHPGALSEGAIETWRAFCAAQPGLQNPLLGPDFTVLMGEIRDDARVAVFTRCGRTVGFLPFHKRPSGFARPIGAAFADYHALVSDPGEWIYGDSALEAVGIGAFGFTGLIDPQNAFTDILTSEQVGYVIELGGDAKTHHEMLRAANPKRYKNWRRLYNKLERECGEVVLTPGDTSREAFDQLLAWKRDQFHRTGTHDVLRPDWARLLFDRAFERQTDELRGVMTTLRAGGRLVAGHFGVAAGGVCHVWISAMDPDCATCAPGMALMLQAPEIMEATNLRAYDLGPGQPHYKAPFATSTVSLCEGLAKAAGGTGRAARSLDNAWALAGDGRIGAVGRLRRRLDHIAAAELSVGGRVRGVMEAIAGYGRRSASREPEQAPAEAIAP